MEHHAKMAWMCRAFFTGASVYMARVCGTGNAARPGCTRGLGKASGAQAISRQAAESQASHRGLSHAKRSVTERRPGLGNGEDRHMTTIQWTDNFATACQQAGQDQKLVLLDFFSPT